MWSEFLLGDLGLIVTGSTPSTSNADNFDGEVPFVTPADLGGVKPITAASRTLSAAGAGRARIIPKDSVLVCCIGATLGKVGITGRGLATNQQINAVIFDQDRILPRFGLHAMLFLGPKLRALAPATTMPIINKSSLKYFSVPVPPLDEQARIVEILDKVSALRSRRYEGIDLLENVGEAVFFEMFGDVSRNERNWSDSQVLEDVATISSGITKGRKAPLGATRLVPYLAVLNVQDKRLDLSKVKEIEATDSEIARYLLLRNDLLLTEGGDPDKLGRGTLWREELPECIHQNHIFKVRVTATQEIDPVFLSWLVSSDRGRRYFMRSAKQTTGIASINMTQLRRFPLLTPPFSLQRSFAERIAEIDRQRAAQLSHLAQLDGLFASVQHRAFRGEL